MAGERKWRRLYASHACCRDCRWATVYPGLKDPSPINVILQPEGLGPVAKDGGQR